MRISVKDLPPHLKRGLSSFYFIVGDDIYQKQKSLQLIYHFAKEQGFHEKRHFDIHAQFDWQLLKQEMNSFSLFASKKIIACHLIEEKLGKQTAEKLNNLILSLPKMDFLLIITSGKLDKTTEQSSWFKLLEQKAICIPTRPLSKDEIFVWLAQEFKAAQLKINQTILHLFYEKTEGNLLAAAQAIEKLKLYFGKPQDNQDNQDQASEQPQKKVELTADDLLQILADNTRFSVYDLVESLLEGTVARTNRILYSLKTEGNEPLLILWSVTREVRAISNICYQLLQGTPLPQALEQAHLWKRKRDLLQQYFTRMVHVIYKNQPDALLSLQKQLDQSLLQAKQIDDMIKGRQVGDVWQALYKLCWTILCIKGVIYA